MPREWTAEQILELARAYQPGCVLAAAADLDLFTHLADGAATAQTLADRLGCDLRGIRTLLDAMAALELVEKDGQSYRLTPSVAACLVGEREGPALAMLQHQANCLRRWVQLPQVVKTGRPAARQPSLRGEAADRQAFLEAMDFACRPLIRPVIAALEPLAFCHLLDVGGATGTWTIAFLRACPGATATLFDLPEAIPLARRRLAAEGLLHRVQLVGGDFYVDDLPGGADFAWLGAIVHQNSRQQNRDLFRKVRAALIPGGKLVIRDVLMDNSHTRPATGALFAINMLVSTEAGGTFSFAELREDLEVAGLTDVTLVRQGAMMDSLIAAIRPA
jgi:precorrin-6B methylase 2